MVVRSFAAVLAFVAGGSVGLAAGSGADAWVLLDREAGLAAMGGGSPTAPDAFIRSKTGQALVWDRAAMSATLLKAPMEFTPEANKPVEIVIPTPTGQLARYAVVESPVMAPELRAQHPEIRTYWGRGIDDPSAVARFDVTPLGFRAMVKAPDDSWTGGTYLIDPATKGDDAICTSYYWRDYSPAGESAPFACGTEDVLGDGHGHADGQNPGGLARSGATLRTYRLAIATTGEFTAFYGSTGAALAAVTTIVNRITGIYEDDLSVRLQMVANNNLLIYPSAATDPFTASNTPGTTNTQLQATLDSTIGTANYDVGHVLHRGSNNGLAGGIGTICQATTKGQGYTSTDPPTGDLIAVDYAAHELGHQFGGRHTFNNCAGGPGDAASVAYEPGSGTTIMAYAGICGTTNIASNSDPDFHAANIDQIQTYLAGTGGPCAATTPTGNLPPVVTVSRRSYSIPSGTPFELTCTATDPDGDPLTYDWDQIDGSTTTNAIPLISTFTVGPTFRSFSAVTSPTRTFQRLSDLLANTFTPGEQIPTVARTMNFRCLVRDNRGGVADTANGAGGPSNEIAVTTVGTTPFQVTSPNTAVVWAGSQTVTWNVAGSTAAPVSCPTVNIRLSTDGGLTFPTTLASGVPNTGSAAVTIPAVASTVTTARIRVEAANNIFFDLSNTNFTIPSPGIEMRTTGVSSVTDTAGTGNSNSILEPGENSVQLFVQGTNVGGTPSSGVTATLQSLSSDITVTPVGAVAYPGLATSAVGNNLLPFVIAVAPTASCGSTHAMRVNFTGPGGPWSSDFSLKLGVPGANILSTVSYTGPAVAIPEQGTANGPNGASVLIPVSGLSGAITNVKFRFDGATCSATAGATTVGLDHTYVGDLIVTLRSPSGTVVTLSNQEGGGGNNFCRTVFDDAAAASITSILSSQAPFTGSWRPENPLSAFNGQSANGNWTLKVVDDGPGDTGSIRAVSLVLSTAGAPVCLPPIAGCACSADFDGSGGTPDSGDVDAFFIAWLAGDASADTDCSGGTPDSGDVDTFFIQWLAGGC